MKNNTFPNFLYIGASKAGSSWIYECLREHPEVFVPEAKDIQFFDRYYDKGLEWYLNFFKGAESYKARGELSHDYFLFDGVADKIKEDLGNIKLIACLREPLDKMISSYKYAKSVYLKKHVTFNEFFFNSSDISTMSKYRDHNMTPQSAKYYENLLPFFELFPPDNILILFFDDLKAEPEKFIKKIYEFLEVDKNFAPNVLNKKILASGKPRNIFLSQIAYLIGGLFRKIGLANLVGAIKRNKLFNQLLFKNKKFEIKVDLQTQQQIRQYYKTDLQKLEKLINKKLPEGWLKEKK
jgi:hypothetical protein